MVLPFTVTTNKFSAYVLSCTFLRGVHRNRVFNVMQDYAQEIGMESPTYRHRFLFPLSRPDIMVWCGDVCWGRGKAHRRSEAEREAAIMALANLRTYCLPPPQVMTKEFFHTEKEVQSVNETFARENTRPLHMRKINTSPVPPYEQEDGKEKKRSQNNDDTLAELETFILDYDSSRHTSPTRVKRFGDGRSDDTPVRKYPLMKQHTPIRDKRHQAEVNRLLRRLVDVHQEIADHLEALVQQTQQLIARGDKHSMV